MKKLPFYLLLIVSIKTFAIVDISSWDEVEAYESGSITGQLPVELSFHTELNLISLTFGSQRLYFEIDTGSPVSTINSTYLEKISNHINGQSIDKRFVLLTAIELGSAKGSDFLFYVQNKEVPPWIAGTLGLNFLSKFYIKLDTKFKNIVFDYPKVEPINGYDFLGYKPNFNARIRIPGSINGRIGGWIVDTGDYHGPLQKIFFQNKSFIDNSIKIAPLIGRFNTTMTALREFDNNIGIAKVVKVGSEILSNFRFVGLMIPEEYQNDASNALGTINYFFLKDSRLLLDFKNQRISIERYSQLSLIDMMNEYLILYGLQLGYKSLMSLNERTVTLLQEGSFLQKAGLQIGDVIIVDSGWNEFHTNYVEPMLSDTIFKTDNKIPQMHFKYMRGDDIFEMTVNYQLPFLNF